MEEFMSSSNQLTLIIFLLQQSSTSRSHLDDFRVASLDIILQDPDVLHIEAETQVFYDDKEDKKGLSGQLLPAAIESLEEFCQVFIVSASVGR